MANISTYPIGTPAPGDLIPGTQKYTNSSGKIENLTRNFTVSSLSSVVNSEFLTFTGDAGGNQTVVLNTQTFTVGGTANEIKTSSTGQTLGVSLADGAYNATPGAGTNLELPDGSAAVTQTAGDNTRKVATTAFVTTAVAVNATLAEVLANGNVTGGTDLAVSAGDDATFTSTSKAIFNSQLEIYSDGTNSYIDDVGIGNIYLRGQTINIENAAGAASYLVLNSTGGTFAGDLTISGGDITSNGVQIISNSTPASTLLIGDVTLGDTIQEMRLQVYGADLINLQDGEISLKSEDIKITGSLSTAAPATYLGLLSSTGRLTKRTPAQVLTDIGGYTVYTALITQTGTAAPVATILKNTTGGTITWTRNDVGRYLATISGATYTTNKTAILLTSGSASATDGRFLKVESGGTTTVQAFYNFDTSANTSQDGIVTGSMIEIRIYS
jgi:hypothetical protein